MSAGGQNGWSDVWVYCKPNGLLQNLNIESKTKRLLMQRLSLLKTSTSSSAIPRNADFHTRLEHDPQLKEAWTLLKKEDWASSSKE